MKLLRNKKYILVLLLLIISVLSCVKDDGTPVAEQSIIDDKIIVEFLRTHKIDSVNVHPPTHINWTIVDANQGDETLANTAIKDTVVVGGVVYYTYYIEITEGKNTESGTKDLMVVDYNEYLLDNTKLSSSEGNTDAVDLEIQSRIEGVQIGLNRFFTGIVPVDDIEFEYRTKTDVPGRGILIFPSGLGYKDIGNDKIAPNQPLRIDLVLYDKKDFIIEE
jgi:hypothetical protein